MDLLRRLIEALRNYLSPPRAPPPVAWLSPPLQPRQDTDDRFGYAQEVKDERDRKESAPRIEEEPAPPPAPQAEPAAPQEVTPPSRKARRAAASEYRKLEKARMKFDKWVTPQGTPAEKAPRAAPAPKPPALETVE